MLTIDCDRLELRPGMTVLDAGCGQGRHSLELLRRGCRPCAVDLNAADLRYARYLLLETARQSYPKPSHPKPSPACQAEPGPAQPGQSAPAPAAGSDRAPSFLVVRGNAEHLPFPDACFDRVLCSEVLEHVADPAHAAAELARVLKPQGMVAVSVPTPTTEWLFRYSSDDYFNSPGGHVRIFRYPRLRRLLNAQGLRVVDLHYEHAFHSLYWWVRCVVGLHAEQHPAIRHGKKVLTHVMFSPALTRAERWLNWLLPKSMVAYARRNDAPRNGAPRDETPRVESLL